MKKNISIMLYLLDIMNKKILCMQGAGLLMKKHLKLMQQEVIKPILFVNPYRITLDKKFISNDEIKGLICSSKRIKSNER